MLKPFFTSSNIATSGQSLLKFYISSKRIFLHIGLLQRSYFFAAHFQIPESDIADGRSSSAKKITFVGIFIMYGNVLKKPIIGTYTFGDKRNELARHITAKRWVRFYPDIFERDIVYPLWHPVRFINYDHFPGTLYPNHINVIIHNPVG